MERHGPRRVLSPSMGVAFLALLVALGGTSYAVTKIDPRSVGTKQLKRNAVARANIKANAVNSAKVAADAITGADVAEASLAQVPSAAAAGSAATAARATLADRATVADRAGAAGALDRIVYRTTTATVAAAPNINESTLGTATARCDAGLLVVGGGTRVEEGVSAVDGFPDGAAAWTATVANDDEAAAHAFTVFAICVAAAQVG
jgi:hypothetical protein